MTAPRTGARQNPRAASIAAFVAGLADAGIGAAFVSPGSRNTPLTLALAAEPRITDVSIRDERAAAFVAVGLAKASGVPAVIACTSGSAAAEYFPAIIEAHQSMTPLIVLTADRPVRLRGSSAPQTTDQALLYGTHVKSFYEHDLAAQGRWRDAAVSIVSEAVSSPPGPVHVNLPFDEPLLPSAAVPPPPASPVTPTEQPGQPTHPTPEAVSRSTKPLIVVGGPTTRRLRSALTRLAARLAAPIIADPQANLTGPDVISYGDLIAGASDSGGTSIALSRFRPDLVVRVGGIPTSKPLWTWLEHSGVDQVIIDNSPFTDPLRSATVEIDGDPASEIESWEIETPRDPSYRAQWMVLDQAAGTAVADNLRAIQFPSEPMVAHALTTDAPEDSILYAASSMPIRDIDAFGIPRPDLEVIANRGVNGIDGTIASALGAALSGRPTTLLAGDLAALYDLSTLTEVARLGAPLRIVVVNNDGGGIFSFLPQASSTAVDDATFERHWATPHGLRLATIAPVLGVAASTPSTLEAFRSKVSTTIAAPELVEVVTDRERNVSDHTRLRAAVAAAINSV